MDETPDYVTVDPTIVPDRFIVMVVRWDKNQGGYVASVCSRRMPRAEADALAQQWAKTRKLEVR